MQNHPVHLPPRRHPVDRVTVFLAAGAVACLIALTGVLPRGNVSPSSQKPSADLSSPSRRAPAIADATPPLAADRVPSASPEEASSVLPAQLLGSPVDLRRSSL